MKTISKFLRTLGVTLSGFLTIVFGYTLIRRLSLSYNSEGNYFDERIPIVYHEQAIVFYGIIFFLLLIIFVVIIFIVKNSKE